MLKNLGASNVSPVNLDRNTIGIDAIEPAIMFRARAAVGIPMNS